MTVVTPDRIPADSRPHCLTAGAWGGHVINVLFAATVLLFFVGLLAIGPVS